MYTHTLAGVSFGTRLSAEVVANVYLSDLQTRAFKMSLSIVSVLLCPCAPEFLLVFSYFLFFSSFFFRNELVRFIVTLSHGESGVTVRLKE